MLNSLTKSSRIISLRHVIVTFGTCLNCQSLSAVKDMHTSISVVVRQAGQAVPDNSGERSISNSRSPVRDVMASNTLPFLGSGRFHRRHCSYRKPRPLTLWSLRIT